MRRAARGCAGREVFLATLDANGNRLGEVQVSAASGVTKSFPHVVFDGAAIVVAWLEFNEHHAIRRSSCGASTRRACRWRRR